MNCEWISDDVVAFSRLLYLYKSALFFWRLLCNCFYIIAFCKKVDMRRGFRGSSPRYSETFWDFENSKDSGSSGGSWGFESGFGGFFMGFCYEKKFKKEGIGVCNNSKIWFWIKSLSFMFISHQLLWAHFWNSFLLDFSFLVFTISQNAKVFTNFS